MMLALRGLALGALLLPSAYAWSVSFYSVDANSCGSSAEPFEYSFYSGSGVVLPAQQCAGDPGEGCEYFTDSGSTENPCTACMSGVGSASVSSGTMCELYAPDTGNSQALVGPTCFVSMA